MIKIFLVWGMVWSFVSAVCIDNTESVTSQLEKKTKKMLDTEEDNLEDAIDTYKEALEKKREMMIKLWTAVAEIEYLMKDNQVLRKEMIHDWNDVKSLHSVM